jgi:DNA repair protein SbcC/Rad50
MINQVKIRNYQSIIDATLEMGQFTIVSGPTNSGKSAFVRALGLWADNASGTSYVTVGAPECSVEVDGIAVFRSPKRSEYVVGTTRFPKSGTSVPDEVREQMPELEIVGQFDPPFLLTETPSAAATMLGQLTGVEKLYAAGREANRIAGSSKQLVKMRQTEIDDVRTQLQPLMDLPVRLQALQRIEEALSGIDALGAQVIAGEALLTELEAITAALRAADAELASLPVLDEIDMEMADLDLSVIQGTEQVLDMVVALHREQAQLQSALVFVESELEDLEQQWAEMTPELCATCPLLVMS